MLFLNCRFWDFKPNSEITNPKSIIDFLDSPILLIRIFGSQPFLPLGFLSRNVQLERQTSKTARQCNYLLSVNIFTCFTPPDIIGHCGSGPIPCARSKFHPPDGCQLLPVGKRSRVLGQAGPGCRCWASLLHHTGHIWSFKRNSTFNYFYSVILPTKAKTIGLPFFTTLLGKESSAHKLSPKSTDPVPLYSMDSKLQNVNKGFLSRNT